LRDFAIATSSPWAIAWLVKGDDWQHLELVIHYNCTLLGGTNNIIVPVSEDGIIWPGFETFLALYDPDFIILAPGLSELTLQSTTLPLNPFAIVEWDQVPQIVADDNLGWRSGQAAQVPSNYRIGPVDPLGRDLIAVANASFPDTSRMALIACGDVQAAELEPDEFDGEVYFTAYGYRETVLGQCAVEDRRAETSARVEDNDHWLPAPSRSDLLAIIKDENQFPLKGAPEILEACASLQHLSTGRWSFVNRTATHRGSGTPRRRLAHLFQIPGMVILVSNNFGFHEAVLFWNLRANEVVTSWLSFSQIAGEKAAICHWLDSDFGASFYTFGYDLAFASARTDLDQLAQIFTELVSERKKDFPEWKTCTYDDVTLYDSERSHLQKRHVLITRNGNDCSFLPDYPLERYGNLATTLEWPTLMLPRNQRLAEEVSDERIQNWPRAFSRGDEIPKPLQTLKCRITDTRHVRFQLSDNSPIRLTIPTMNRVLERLLDEAGFGEVHESNHAQYQHAFIKRCGSLPDACHILKTSPYRELLTLLASSQNNSALLGRPLKEPRRRALFQSELWSKLNRPVPLQTEEYLKESERLPPEASQLIRLQLLERGFELTCSLCSATIWYRAEEVGQTFRCHRCYEQQQVHTNPMWLYKLPEVVFQLFENDADVALLALFRLLRGSTKNFQYVVDSEFFDRTQRKKGNIDFACLSDGKVYIGEAKSNLTIDQEQFGFYESLVLRSKIDGVVFATSAPRWNPGTVTRIEELKSKFKGDVLMWTEVEILKT